MIAPDEVARRGAHVGIRPRKLQSDVMLKNVKKMSWREHTRVR